MRREKERTEKRQHNYKMLELEAGVVTLDGIWKREVCREVHLLYENTRQASHLIGRNEAFLSWNNANNFMLFLSNQIHWGEMNG